MGSAGVDSTGTFLLAVDQGNSQTVFGLYPTDSGQAGLGGSVSAPKPAGLPAPALGRTASTPWASWRLATDVQRTADETRALLTTLASQYVECEQVRAVAFASVVPPAAPAVLEACRRTFPAAAEPLVERPAQAQRAGLKIGYPHAEEVGIDILCNCVAALCRFGPAPIMVVDFGTALTVAVMDQSGVFLGGVIAPGVETTRNALFQRTAQLPMVELVAPPRLLNPSTTAAIQAGLVYGAAGQVDGLVDRLRAELGLEHSRTRIVATGGLARLVAPHTRVVDVIEPFLTLDGTRLIYERATRASGI